MNKLTIIRFEKRRRKKIKTTSRPAFAKASAVALRAMADKSADRQNIIAAAIAFIAMARQ